MTEKIVQELKNIIANELDVNISLNEIDAEVSLFEDGIGLDSIAVMEFISMIEDRYGFQFSDEELNMESFKNLAMLSRFIQRKRGVQ